MYDSRTFSKGYMPLHRQHWGSIGSVDNTSIPSLARCPSTSSPASINTSSSKTSRQPLKLRRIRTRPESVEINTAVTSNVWKRHRFANKITATQKTVQRSVHRPVRIPAQRIAASSIVPPKSPMLQTRFYAIDLSETKRKRWSFKFDEARTRDGSTMRPWLTPGTYRSEERSGNSLRREVEKDKKSLISTSEISAASLIAVRKPSDSRLGKLVARAIRNASTTGAPVMGATQQSLATAPCIRNDPPSVSKKQRVHITPPKKPRSVFPHAEEQAKVVQQRIVALDDDSSAGKSQIIDAVVWRGGHYPQIVDLTVYKGHEGGIIHR